MHNRTDTVSREECSREFLKQFITSFVADPEIILLVEFTKYCALEIFNPSQFSPSLAATKNSVN